MSGSQLRARSGSIMTISAVIATCGISGLLNPATANSQIALVGKFSATGDEQKLTYTGGSGTCAYTIGTDRTASFSITDATEHQDCPDLATAGDVDGDGADEVVLAWWAFSPYLDHDLLVLEPATGEVTKHAGVNQPTILGTADFTGDGAEEVWVWTDQTNSLFTFGNAAQNFADQKTFCTGSGKNGMLIADLNGDGAQEVITGGPDFAEDDCPVTVYSAKTNATQKVADVPQDATSTALALAGTTAAGQTILRVTHENGESQNSTDYVQSPAGDWTQYTPQATPTAEPTPTATAEPTPTPEPSVSAPTTQPTTSTPTPLPPQPSTSEGAQVPNQTVLPDVAKAKSSAALSPQRGSQSAPGQSSARALVVPMIGEQVQGSTGGGQVAKSAQRIPVVLAAPPVAAWDIRPAGVQLDNHTRGVQLDGVQLDVLPAGVQLDGVQLDGVQLDGVQLDGVQLDGVQLDGVQLDGVQLDVLPAGVQLDNHTRGVQLDNYTRGVQLDNHTRGAQLDGVQLDGVQLDVLPAGVQLDNHTRGVQLDNYTRGVQLDGVQLDGVQLDVLPAGVQLDNHTRGVQLDNHTRGVQLDGVQLDGVQLDGVQLDGVQLDNHTRGVQLDNHTRGVQLDGVQLDGVQLDGVQLDGVQLDGVQLDGVQLDGVQLDNHTRGVQLDGVQLDGVQLDCVLSGKLTAGNQLTQATLSCTTPQGVQLDAVQA